MTSCASLFCGLYERAHSYTFRRGAIKESYMVISYLNQLRKVGYYIGFFGKFGVKYPKVDELFDVEVIYDRPFKYKD